jgi:F-type H+-transporting ATPase subunit gamma
MDVSISEMTCPSIKYLTCVQNASKNAGDMIGKFTILFNRTRQAVITTELVDIITGASASQD